MRRFLTILALIVELFILMAAPARAEPDVLTAPEIEALLSGNTAVGDWSGTPYRQFFDENGTTIYVPQGGREDWGRWRTNAETGQYESFWERSGWSGYGVAGGDGQYFWVQSDGTRQPFEMVEGRALSD
ncbi:MAG: hypothetical protein AAGI70_17050 [Pseudomonadota bacterium]